MVTSSNPRTPFREPKRKRDTGLDFFGLGSDHDDFCTPPGATRKVAPTTPLTRRSPNAAASPCGPKAIIDKNLFPEHGAPTAFVVDFDPISPHTFVDDVEGVAEGTADKVKAGVRVPAYMPPSTQAQIGRSCGSTQMSDWNRLQKEENLENYSGPARWRADANERLLKRYSGDNDDASSR